MTEERSPVPAPDVPHLESVLGSLALPCNLLLLIWGVHTLLKPGNPSGEELFVFYYWVIPILMAVPAWVAIHTWLDRWALTKRQLIVRNVPFALALAVWVWVALLPA